MGSEMCIRDSCLGIARTLNHEIIASLISYFDIAVYFLYSFGNNVYHFKMNFAMKCDNDGTICTGHRIYKRNCEEITWEQFPCYYNPFRCRKHHVEGIILN